MPTDNETGSITVIARAKLPDDLSFLEFRDLIDAVQVLAKAALEETSLLENAGNGPITKLRAPQPTVQRVRYGSAFEVILTVDGTSAISALSVGAAFLMFAHGIRILSKSGKNVSQAGLDNEKRLGRRSKRKRAEVEYARAAHKLSDTNRAIERAALRKAQREALDELVPVATRDEVDKALPGTPSTEMYAALSELADYGIEVRVEQNGTEISEQVRVQEAAQTPEQGVE